jgi:hypothetical protein
LALQEMQQTLTIIEAKIAHYRSLEQQQLCDAEKITDEQQNIMKEIER